MNIYERLKKDHETQRDLCAKLAETEEGSSERAELWDSLKEELEAHALAEEQVFYSNMMKKTDGTEHARHSVHEHQQMTEMINELDAMDQNADIWTKKFGKLSDRVIHHVDEEEADIFPVARDVIASETANEMTERFNERKKEAVSG
ncbi:MAG: hemerythrin domain-containing protein [Hyphomonadaceae bacterium]|nr:hemerythrin domain-containing protein [Hyphomonadaceae bacterium]